MPLQGPAQFAKRTLATLAVVLVAVGWPGSSTADGFTPLVSQPTPREIIISGAKWAQGVIVSVHDILVVPPPARYEQWRVHSGSDDVVRLLTKGDRVRRPGAGGWRFEAIGHGSTTLTFVPFVPSGETSSAPNEPRFTLQVTVK